MSRPEANIHFEYTSPGVLTDPLASALYNTVREEALAVIAERRSIFSEKMRMKDLAEAGGSLASSSSSTSSDASSSTTSNNVTPNGQPTTSLPTEVALYLEVGLRASAEVMEIAEFAWLQCFVFPEAAVSFSDCMEGADLTGDVMRKLKLLMMRHAATRDPSRM